MWISKIAAVSVRKLAWIENIFTTVKTGKNLLTVTSKHCGQTWGMRTWVNFARPRAISRSKKNNLLSSKIFDNELQRSWKHTKGNQLKENVERLFLNRYSFDLLFFSFIKKVVDCYKTVADWFVKLFRSKARQPLRTKSCLTVRTCKAFYRWKDTGKLNGFKILLVS